MILIRNRLCRAIFLIVLLTISLVPSIVQANDTITPLVEPQIEAANDTLKVGLIITIAVIAGGLYWTYTANRNIMKQLEKETRN